MAFIAGAVVGAVIGAMISASYLWADVKAAHEMVDKMAAHHREYKYATDRLVSSLEKRVTDLTGEVLI